MILVGRGLFQGRVLINGMEKLHLQWLVEKQEVHTIVRSESLHFCCLSVNIIYKYKDSGIVYCSEWPAQQGSLWIGGDGSQFGGGGGGGYYGGGGGGLLNIYI